MLIHQKMLHRLHWSSIDKSTAQEMKTVAQIGWVALILTH